MFEKLLSLIPYSPGLTHQMAFYGKRMREEAIVRRTGLVFVSLAFLVQLFAVVAPPISTVAYSTNDMIDNGITSQAEAVTNCQNDTKSYGTVLADFGISCSDVAHATVIYPLDSTSVINGQQLYSMGWLSQGPINMATHKATNQTVITPLNNVPASELPLYGRLLSSFDTYSHSDYKALSLTSSVTGKHYYILFSCGNLVSIGQPVPLPLPKPVVKTPPPATCPQDTNILASNSLCKACPYQTTILKSSPMCVECPNSNHPGILKSSPECVPVCQYPGLSNYDTGSPQCVPCTKAISSQNTLPCLIIHKTATNVTEGIANADGTTAKAGDTILYTLYAYNSGKAPIDNYTFDDNLGYVLDYANLASDNGGSLSSTDALTWPALNIKAGATVTKQFSVTVTDPQTPADPNDVGLYDLVMTNYFGNTINIKVPGSPVKTIVETAAVTSLPNTGPGTSLFIAAGVVAVAGYFFFRSRLLATEANMVLKDSGPNGEF